MTGFVLLLSQQLNLLSSQSQRKAICVQEKRGGLGHSASIRTNKGEGIQFQNPWTGFQKLTSLDISFVCHLILGQTGGRDVLFFVSSAEFNMLTVLGSRAQAPPHPASRASYPPRYKVRSLCVALPFPLFSPLLPVTPEDFAVPWHCCDTRQSMFLLCLVIPGRGESCLSCSDCSGSGVSLLLVAH